MTGSQVAGLMLVEVFAHRTANEYAQAIASLRQAAKATADPAAREHLLRAAERLFSHADVHRALAMPPPGVHRNLSDTLTTLCAALTASLLADRNIRLRLVASDVLLEGGRCWRLSLIVSELVHNAARHGLAFGGEIVVELTCQGDQLICSVRDDGRAKGAPVSGRGRRVVSALATELGGRADWRFTLEGSCGWVVIPNHGGF